MRKSEDLKRDKVVDLATALPKRFFITDFSHNHKVYLDTNMNKEAKRNYIARLVVDDIEVYVDRDELIMALSTD